MSRGRRPDSWREEFWRDTLADWKASGLSVREFCRQSDLHESAFYLWRRQLGLHVARTPRPSAAGDTPTPAFVPIRVVATHPLEVVVASGQVVRVAPGFDPAHLRALVAALEGKPC